VNEKRELTVHAEPLPKDRMLAFYSESGTGTVTTNQGEYRFKVLSSISGMGLAIEIEGPAIISGLHTETMDLQPMVQAWVQDIVQQAQIERGL